MSTFQMSMARRYALCWLSAVNDWYIDQMDDVTTFLNAPMGDEELYERVPEGFV